MIRRIDHVAIAVRDLDRAREFFLGGLGGRELFSRPFPEQKFRWTTVELGTSCFIELCDPLEESGFLHRFIHTRGEGPHHITMQVDDIAQAREELERRGIPTFGYSESLPGWKEMFIHPRHAFGTLFQLAEFNPLDWIEPGYIPASYREFLPSGQAGPGEEKVEVRRVESAAGPQVEIRRGEEKIRLSPAQVAELMEELQGQSGR